MMNFELTRGMSFCRRPSNRLERRMPRRVKELEVEKVHRSTHGLAMRDEFL